MNQPLKHVAFILDGNGRWAQQRGLSRLQGHAEGAKRALDIAKYAFQQCHIPFITYYAFSTDNWKRPKLEVEAIFHLLSRYLKKYREVLLRENIRLRTIGDISALPAHLYKELLSIQEETQHFSSYNLTLALNYGAREETLRAIKHYVEEGQDVSQLTWNSFSRYLYTADIPDPELLIRTSGEIRLSNYLCLQLAYSEMYFTPTYWPDFDKNAFDAALENYQHRERRFGGIKQ